MHRARPTVRPGVALLSALAVAACAPAATEEDARAAAARFADAVRARDGAAVCALLSERARTKLTAAGEPCAAALPWPALATGAPGTATVWGDRAQVPAGPDTLFLAQYTEGWRVTGAGCRPAGAEQPYECAVGGA